MNIYHAYAEYLNPDIKQISAWLTLKAVSFDRIHAPAKIITHRWNGFAGKKVME